MPMIHGGPPDINQNFGLLTAKCEGCHFKQRFNIDDMPMDHLKEDLFKKVVLDHGDFLSHCIKTDLRIVIVPVFRLTGDYYGT